MKVWGSASRLAAARARLDRPATALPGAACARPQERRRAVRCIARSAAPVSWPDVEAAAPLAARSLRIVGTSGPASGARRGLARAAAGLPAAPPLRTPRVLLVVPLALTRFCRARSAAAAAFSRSLRRCSSRRARSSSCGARVGVGAGG